MDPLNFNNSQILVVGDVMLDQFYKGHCQRISPEAPVPVVHVQEVEGRAGGAANVAANIASLGGTVTLLSAIGQEEAGTELKDVLSQLKVKQALISDPTIKTTTKLRVLGQQQQLIRLDFEQKLAEQFTQPLAESFARKLEGHKLVILSDYAKGVLRQPQDFIRLCKQRSIPVLVDPKGLDYEKYRGATLIKPNFSEFKQVVGEVESENQLVEKAHNLLQQLDVNYLLVTRSEQGMTLIEKGRQVIHVHSRAREVFDVTGAGDTVIATLATAMASGQTIDEALHLANVAAGIVVGRVGTARVSVEDISQHSGQTTLMEKLPKLDQLKEFVNEAQQEGKRVVLTNGCFDIIHAGHIDSLRRARALGDYLIVAVNSDDSVKGLKGESRPFNKLQDRMEVLAALESVSWVVAFDQDTPQQLIEYLLPDVLVKGGDYQVHEIAGAAAVQKQGGEVVILPLREGRSTTGLFKKIKNSAEK
ncbi:MAG: bifunctional D-glycero-beta-D-manno-heptose-7-phosphate kinase/D-glycero-beta-D-manno-heptose 1-phosphate adenylyltransferase HldE [bacterium]